MILFYNKYYDYIFVYCLIIKLLPIIIVVGINYNQSQYYLNN